MVFIRLLLCTFLASFLFSFYLWSNQRDFPLFPLFTINIDGFHQICQYSLLTFTVIGIIIPKKSIVKIWLFFLLLMIALDQLRLQPWVYFISICLLPLTFKIAETDILKYLKILFVIVYFWTGFHKLNTNFTDFIFESILVDGFHIYNTELLSTLKKFSYLIPITEISIAITLLFKQTRKIGVLGIITTHLLIIHYLVFGVKGNFVVIPWNFLMIIMGILLFYTDKNKMLFPEKRFLNLVLTIIAILPVGLLMNKIDQVVSFSLYDAKLKNLYLLEKNTHQKGVYLDANLFKDGAIKDINSWCFKEVNVPFYPEKRFIKQLQQHKTTKQGTFLYTYIPLWNRNLLGTYKNAATLKRFQLLDSIHPVIFKKPLYFPEYKILK